MSQTDKRRQDPIASTPHLGAHSISGGPVAKTHTESLRTVHLAEPCADGLCPQSALLRFGWRMKDPGTCACRAAPHSRRGAAAQLSVQGQCADGAGGDQAVGSMDCLCAGSQQALQATGLMTIGSRSECPIHSAKRPLPSHHFRQLHHDIAAGKALATLARRLHDSTPFSVVGILRTLL